MALQRYWLMALLPLFGLGCGPSSSTTDASAKKDMSAVLDGGGSDDASIFVDMAPVQGSAQIMAARKAASDTATDAGVSGDVSIPIQEVFVTYVKPPIETLDAGVPSDDREGFFIQAEKTGPAIYVAVAPGTLTPLPKPGDKVSFVATHVALNNGVRWITAVSDYQRLAESGPSTVDNLKNDVSSVDTLVDSVDTWESRIVEVKVYVTGASTGGGGGYRQFPIATEGYPAGDKYLKLRLPPLIAAATSVGCYRVTTTPLWRYNKVAQISAWTSSEIVSATGCVAPPLPGDAAVPQDAGTYDAAQPQDGGVITCPTSDIVISQVYGGGGMCTYYPDPEDVCRDPYAVYTNDFIELHNKSATSKSLDGWSVKYASATGTTWNNSTDLSGKSIEGGGYLLVSGASINGCTNDTEPCGNGLEMSLFDVVGSLAISATKGKVALVEGAGTTLTGNCPTNVKDLVTYGATADSCFGSPAPAPSVATSVKRTDDCVNACNNAGEFAAGTPTPRYWTSPVHTCN